eukprot:Skav203316  [mRNA]  locus=scaffold1007:101871:114161:- [translate_table: standard]
MRWTIRVCFLNGETVPVNIDSEASVEDLRLEVQRKIKKQVRGLTLMRTACGLAGTSKLEVSSSLQQAGLQDGQDVTGLLGGDDVKVKAHKFGWGFGAIINGGLRIWGHEFFFKMTPEQSKKTEKDVLELFFTETAVAAVTTEGEVVTCGDKNAGGDSTSVQDQLTDVISISGTSLAFAALKADATVVCWGDPDSGGDCAKVQAQLQGIRIRQVFPCQNAFAAVTDAGRVITWGQADQGGDCSEVQGQLVGVKHIAASAHAFAAILGDGSVVSWGSPDAGGDSSSVREKLTKVKAVYATKFAFAAVKEDGTVVTWGPAEHGGRTDGHLYQHPVKPESIAEENVSTLMAVHESTAKTVQICRVLRTNGRPLRPISARGQASDDGVLEAGGADSCALMKLHPTGSATVTFRNFIRQLKPLTKALDSVLTGRITPSQSLA